jgi:hypothetical protein
MVIDYERVMLGFKAHIMSKRSHGQDELLRVFTQLEVESRIPEGQEMFDPRPIPRSTPSQNDAKAQEAPVA